MQFQKCFKTTILLCIFFLDKQDLKSEDDNIAAVIFPGGFGAAKNLCTFAVASDPEVDEEVKRVLLEFHGAGKPIGMCCISPIIAAMVFKDNPAKEPVKLTLGRREIIDGESGNWPYATTIDKAEEFGANMVECGVDEVCIDEANKIVTTPAFMYEGEFHEVYDGINKMVNTLFGMAES